MKTTTVKTTAKWMAGLFLSLATAVPCKAQDSMAAAQPRARRVVMVSIPDRRLAVTEDGKVIAYFPVAVGAAVSPSPEGEFEIVSRVANPTYYHGGVVMGPGRDNPLGTRWMGLNVKGYGIHGTNAPASVGHATSHGCIRLKNRDVEKLYAMLRVGDVVEIHGEPEEEVAAVFDGAVRAAESVAGLETSGQ